MQLFKNGQDQLRENPDRALPNRTFRVLLLGTNPQAKVDPQADVTLDDVIDNHRENARAGDVACRLQVIGNPTQPFGVRDRLFQFFVEEMSRPTVRDNFGSGVLYEQAEDEQVPIAFLSRDDLGRMISGEGATIHMPFDSSEPPAAAPVLEGAGAATAQANADKDANNVPDQREYVDGDPDKGVRSDAGVERVALVGSEQTAKPGTVSAENVAGAQASSVENDTPALLSDEELEAQADADGEGDGEISTLTRPTLLAEKFTRTELKEYAEQNEIDVYRRDGESGAPLASDYARAVAGFNRRKKSQA